MTLRVAKINKWISRLTPASQHVQETFNRTFDRQVKLAITGLSRSGKTVFISSLVHQLVHGLEGTNLPFFEIASDGRLHGCRIMQQPDLYIPAFPYEKAVENNNKYYNSQK